MIEHYDKSKLYLTTLFMWRQRSSLLTKMHSGPSIQGSSQDVECFPSQAEWINTLSKLLKIFAKR